MARVPFSGVPEVQQQSPAGAFEHVQATPQEFGAGVGQAEQGLGQSVQKFGDVLAQNAIRLQEQTNDRDANQAINKYMQAAGDEWAKYGSMQGQQAFDYRPTYQKNLSDLRDQFGAALPTDAARLAYDNYSRFMTTRWVNQGAEHAAAGLRQSYSLTNQQSFESSVQQGILNQNDPTQVALAAARAASSMRQDAVNQHGATPEQAAAAEQKGRSLFYTKLFGDMIKTGGVDKAQKYYNVVRPHLDGDSILAIDREMQPANDRAAGDAAAQDAYIAAVGMNPGNQDPIVRGAIIDQANKSGVNPSVALTVAQIESHMGASPDTPGNSHKGVFQLGDKEWASIGGTEANRGDKVAQSQLGTQWVAGAQKAASDALGRPAEGWETYMVHQQGTEGGRALLTAPSGESAVDALTPAYKGNRAQATRAITNNGGSADMTAQQFTAMWQTRYAAASGQASGAVFPTSGDARQPLTGDQILAAVNGVENRPGLNPGGVEWARRKVEQRLSAFNQALHADAQNAINGIATKILQNPYSVSMTDIATNPHLTGTEKISMSNELVRLQSGRAQGEGTSFGPIIDQVNAPIGSPGRINSDRDLVPFFQDGKLTFSGYEKAKAFIKDRDAPDGPALKAAQDRWQTLILTGGGWGTKADATDATRQKWADFLAVLPGTINQYRGKMPMSEIIGANGPIQKMIDGGHFVLSSEEMYKSTVGSGSPATGQSLGQTGTVGHWYVPVGGQYQEVRPGTPGARQLTAPELRVGNFRSPPPPSAPADER